ncbi:YeeE/YedE family protein [Sphaerotilus mobilis]|uniref:Sulphur transport domain-containing protein n=1 Tax=Sphaerotilus mobilis TaxID=47994 RepID=A0A4Q7LT62_9BURK|nr:YeeE/YedE family protein [Sphaerotilus mobilis]RZS56939.1 hypothetical protein EV685_1495 [Sphaerotilus mobilis]
MNTLKHPNPTLRHVYALLSGLLFGLGLIAGGMTDPAKVKAFLDLAGAWDPSLAFVMGGAIAVGVFAFAAARRRSRSLSGDPMEIPSSTVIDARLLIGGVLFGAGWGVGGFCPGPAIVAAGSGLSSAWIFIVAMLAGMLVHDRWLAR